MKDTQMDTFGTRLRNERKRLNLTQEEFGVGCNIQKGTQVHYELDNRLPNANYLRHAATLGADVLYLVVGRHEENTLADDEGELLKYYRTQHPAKKDAIRALLRCMADDEKNG